MVRFNERKLQVLAYISRCYSATAWQLAKDLGLEIHNARMLLKRYYRMGLLRREKCSTGEYCYWLSEEGKRRLNYLASILLPG